MLTLCKEPSLQRPDIWGLPQLVLHLVYKRSYFLWRPDNLHVCPSFAEGILSFLGSPGVTSVRHIFRDVSWLSFLGLESGGGEWN